MTQLQMVELLSVPAYEKHGVMLFQVVSLFLNIFPTYGADKDTIKAKIHTWCNELEAFPLYAVEAAMANLRRNSKREPSLAEAIYEVRWRRAYGLDVEKLVLGLGELIKPRLKRG